MFDLSQLLLKNSFMIGKIEIYYYALCIAAGMLACAILAVPLFKRHGLQGDFILDVMIAIIPCSIVFARIWYVLLDIKEFDSFLEVIDIRGGGMAIHGGILGGAIGLLIISKIYKKDLSKLFDLGACLLPLGQAMGRWGNFFNQEVYGRPTNITTPFISVYIEETGGYHYALCFYEMALNLILFAILFTFMWKYRGKRYLYASGAYMIGYGVIRAVLEPFRMPDFQMGNFGIPTSIITAVLMIIAGVIMLAYSIYKDVKEGNYWWKTFFVDGGAPKGDVAIQNVEAAENETGDNQQSNN